jgi:hypothetical protein
MAEPNITQKGFEQFVEQKITQQVTIAAAATGVVSVTVPANGKAYLKGYGYTYFASNTFTLRAGTFVLPSRTDQEGSPSIPIIYGNPFPVNSGEKIELTILNGDSAEHTYDVVFYIITNRIIAVNSTGGELTLATSSGTGTGSSVAIYDSSFTTAAGVSALGLAVSQSSPTTLLQGTKTAGVAGASLAASTACKKVTLGTKTTAVSDADGYALYIGNATGQDFPLFAGQFITIDISNLATVYVKRAGASDVTVYYLGA